MIGGKLAYSLEIPEMSIPGLVEKVARVLYYNVAYTFATDTSPNGVPWKAHSPRYWRYAGGRKLPKPYKKNVWTGEMFHSIRPLAVDNIATVIGTDVKILYNNPIRPFLPTGEAFPTSWQQAVMDTIIGEVNKFYG